MDCLFCKISSKEIPAKLVHEDRECVAFHDIHPQAPTHLLIIPRKHIAKLSETTEEDKILSGHLLSVVRDIASKNNLQDFRIVINNGSGAGQTVWHLHLHLLAGRTLTWPPG